MSNTENLTPSLVRDSRGNMDRTVTPPTWNEPSRKSSACTIKPIGTIRRPRAALEAAGYLSKHQAAARRLK